MCQEGLKAQYYLNMAKALRIDTQQEILFKPKDIIASHNGEEESKAYEYIRKVYKDKPPFRVIKDGTNYRITAVL